MRIVDENNEPVHDLGRVEPWGHAVEVEGERYPITRITYSYSGIKIDWLGQVDYNI